MPPYTFKATTDPLTINADNHVQFKNVVDNTLEAQYDPDTGTLVTPRTGTYALSFACVPNKGYETITSPVVDCEIVVDGVETPLVLNERRNNARVVLQLDSDKRVWVEFFGDYNSLQCLGVFSVCLLHGSSN